MGFAQVDKPNISTWIAIDSWPTLRVWLALVQRADRGNRVIITDNDLMLSANVGRSSLFSAFKSLSEMKFIERAGGVIHLNSTLVWSGSRDDMAMAHMCCAVEVQKKKA